MTFTRGHRAGSGIMVEGINVGDDVIVGDDAQHLIQDFKDALMICIEHEKTVVSNKEGVEPYHRLWAIYEGNIVVSGHISNPDLGRYCGNYSMPMIFVRNKPYILNGDPMPSFKSEVNQ